MPWLDVLTNVLMGRLNHRGQFSSLLGLFTAAERAMAFWPNKGEADPRPALGEDYQRVAPVVPQQPVVPESASGALRLPIVSVS